MKIRIDLRTSHRLFFWIGISSICVFNANMAPAQTKPLVTTVDLDIDEETTVEVGEDVQVVVRLDAVRETRDSVMNALSSVEVDVTIDGQQATLTSGLYRLPLQVGSVQIDCPVTIGYNHDSHIDHWGLRQAARLRLWPAESPWIRPGSFVYPVGQKWFASQTWFSNEAVSARPNGQFYYHSGLDIGGSEGQTPVYAATDGTVVSVANHSVENLPKAAVQPRYDVIYLRDERGWLYRYSHLDSIQTAVQLGKTVRAGQRIGTVGKEGASGGWSHLHFEIKSLQPSGEWGTQDGYAFLWQAWQEQHQPDVIAVARPRYLARPGQRVTLDASRSWSRNGTLRYEWNFTDGTTASGKTVERLYPRPGNYNEILTITDDEGHTDVDFAIVKVVPGNDPADVAGMHATYFPTMNLRPGTPITFKVRARGSTEGADVWDFGDGSDPVTVQSNTDSAGHAPAGKGYVTTIHQYQHPGRYIVTVRRDAESGMAWEHLHVVVGKPE